MASLQLLHKELTYHIRGAAFDVWNAFGGAFKEKIVERALAQAINKRGLNTETQKRIIVHFDGKPVGHYTPDVIVDGLVLVELKCKPFVTVEDRRQFWYYLKASDYKVGLLINFGPDKLTILRRVYDTARFFIPRTSALSSA